MSKPTIAVDVDDVLATFGAQLIEFSNKIWGTDLSIEDVSEDWSEMWQLDHATTRERARVLHDEIFSDLEHVSEAKGILEALSHDYRLVITTSRQHKLKQVTIDWINKYFPDVFDEIHHAAIFDGPFTKETFERTKLELCQEIGADYLIDDQPKHCFAMAEAGMTALLFGDYPWNRTNKTHPLVKRVYDWHQVGEYFAKKRV